MPDTNDITAARRALLEKYLQASTATATRKDPMPVLDNPRGRIVPIKAHGSKPPFFYLHGDWRGQAFYCFPLARDLGEDQPFYIIEPYTFEELKIPPTIEEIATIHLRYLRTTQPEGPYYLGGWCNGALIAYEMAHQLHVQGQQVALLVLMDTMNPGRLKSVRRAVSLFCRLARLGRDRELDGFLLVRHIYRYIRFSHYRHSYSSDFAASQDEQKGERKKAPLFPGADFLRQDYPGIVDWLNAGYIPDPYPGQVTFFWTSKERGKKWMRQTEAAETYFLPGSHITSRTEHLSDVAEYLSTCLNKAQKVVQG